MREMWGTLFEAVDRWSCTWLLGRYFSHTECIVGGGGGGDIADHSAVRAGWREAVCRQHGVGIGCRYQNSRWKESHVPEKKPQGLLQLTKRAFCRQVMTSSGSAFVTGDVVDEGAGVDEAMCVGETAWARGEQWWQQSCLQSWTANQYRYLFAIDIDKGRNG